MVRNEAKYQKQNRKLPSPQAPEYCDSKSASAMKTTRIQRLNPCSRATTYPKSSKRKPINFNIHQCGEDRVCYFMRIAVYYNPPRRRRSCKMSELAAAANSKKSRI